MASNMETRASKRRRRESSRQKNQQKKRAKRRSSWRPQSPRTHATKSPASSPLQQASDTYPQSQEPVSRQPTPDPSSDRLASALIQKVDQPCTIPAEGNFGFIFKWLETCEGQQERASAGQFGSVDAFFGQSDTAFVEPPGSALCEGAGDPPLGPSVSEAGTMTTGVSRPSQIPTYQTQYLKRNLLDNGFEIISLNVAGKDQGISQRAKAFCDTYVGKAPESASELSPEDMQSALTIAAKICDTIPEARVAQLYQIHILPQEDESIGLGCTGAQLMPRDTIPPMPTAWQISIPKPDVMHGYNCNYAFTADQRQQLYNFGTSLDAISQEADLKLPFLVCEIKGGVGKPWVARNQIIGGIHTCLHITESLNLKLDEAISTIYPRLTPLQRSKEKSLPRRSSSIKFPDFIDQFTVGITMDTQAATIYLGYQDGNRRKVVEYDACIIRKRRDFEEFHQYLTNIMSWGTGRRLEQVRAALDFIEKANMVTEKRAADAATSTAASTRKTISASKKRVQRKGGGKTAKTPAKATRKQRSRAARSMASDSDA